MSYNPPYISPRGPGRPPQREDLPITVDNFSSGTDQHNPTTKSVGGISRIINGRCTLGSTLDRRHGKIVVGSAGDAGQVYMLASLQVSNGTDILLRIIEGEGAGVQLQKYDSGWYDIGNNIGIADDRVDFSWTSIKIAGEDRLYFTNGVSDLQYTNGTTLTEVVGIKAKYITHIGDVLAIGHPTETFYANEVVYAKANTHVFHSDLDDSYSASTQRFRMPGEITQVHGFNSLLYAFTKADGLFEIDLSDDTDRQISTHGTVSPKSVATSWDVMVWSDQDGVWALPMNGDVLKVSTSVDNIYSQTTASNIMQMVGGFNTQGQYELHLGTLTYLGVEYQNYCLVYEIEQSRQLGKNTWKEDAGKEFPNNMVNWTNAYGYTQNYYGSRTNQTTYQNDYGYEDGAGEEIELLIETMDVSLASEKEEAMLGDVYLTYEPNGSETIPLSLYARTDTESWKLLKAIDLPTGSISMKTVRVQGIPALIGRSFAFKMVSSDTKSFRFYKLFATYSMTNSDNLPI